MTRYVESAEIDALTAHHPPTSDDVVAAHEAVRAVVNQTMHMLNDLLAESPQKTHLIRVMLPQVMMAANQVIAVHGLLTED